MVKVRNTSRQQQGPFEVRYSAPRTRATKVHRAHAKAAAETKVAVMAGSLVFGPRGSDTAEHEVDERDIQSGPLARAISNPANGLQIVK